MWELVFGVIPANAGIYSRRIEFQGIPGRRLHCAWNGEPLIDTQRSLHLCVEIFLNVVRNDMELAPEDSLRLNVLLAQELKAVRIDESRMTVHALTAEGEAVVPLNPNRRDDQYLKGVRELLSSQVLGSPGGYPVFLKRWTRMGQTRDDNLDSLLLLGEPEAVVAVVHAAGLTPEHARLAWWAMPEADNARRMLERKAIAESEVGQELARHLLDYLPFETEAKAIQDTVRLVLQPGLATDAVRQDLWQKAGRKGVYYVGFLQACPDELPESCPAHPEWEGTRQALAELHEAGNPFAALLCKALSPEGQMFLKVAELAMGKLANQDATVALFEAIGSYFAAARLAAVACRDSEAAVAHAEVCVNAPLSTAPGLADVLAATPEQRERLTALLTLAMAGEAMLDSFFAYSDAVGPLMRRKLAPWTEPMLAQMQRLRS